MTLSDAKKQEIVDSIGRYYENACQAKLANDLEGLYIFGSYAFGKISLDIPDINYFLLLKEDVAPGFFLQHAEILKDVVHHFKDVATVRPEYRPIRYMLPRVKGGDFVVFMCLRYTRMEDRFGPIPFGMGWVLEAVLQTRKLVFGKDSLADVVQPPPTKDYLKAFFPEAFTRVWQTLESAPFQYVLPEESEMLMHEAHKVAQMASIGFGVTLALDEKELAEKKWLAYVTDKPKLIEFYKTRYDEATAKNVEIMLDVRENWFKHAKDPEMAIKMYKAAIDICTRLKARHREMMGESG
jgi:hypothetical protein